MAALATLLCTATPALELSVRSEARGRTALPGEVSSDVSRDLQLDPRAALSFGGGELQGFVAYAPRILFLDVGTGAARTAPLHRAELSASLREDASLRLLAAGRFAAGTEDFSPLTSTAAPSALPAPAPDRLSGLRPLQSIAGDGSLGFEQRFGQRFRLTGAAGYGVFGGLRDQDREVLPLRQGPRGNLQFSFHPDRRDELAASAQVEHLIFDTGRAVTVTEGTLAWTRNLERDLRLELAAGGAGVRAFGGDSPELTLRARPVLSAGLEKSLPVRGERLTAAARGRIGPAVDRLSGDVYERAEGSLSIDWLPVRHFGLAVRGGASSPLEGALQGQTVSTGELEARLLPHRSVAFSAGLRGLAGSQGALVGPPVQWGAFVAASFASREDL